MTRNSLPISITSIALIVVGAGLLGLNIATRGQYNVALPLVFLVLSGAFLIVVFSLRAKNVWASLLYIPAALLAAFGIIFLLNVLTGDWKSWAYAWLFLLAGLGVGLLLANREHAWSPLLNPIGWGLTLAGITFFAIFGVIAGGLFIQIMAPILLVAAGLSLRWLHLETILPERLRSRLMPVSRTLDGRDGLVNHTAVETLVEPLSSREVEVLRLINGGYSNQQIADRLSIAQSTVKTHINNIYGKLGVETRVQAVNRARALNLLN